MHHHMTRLSMTAATLLSFALPVQRKRAEYVTVVSRPPIHECDAPGPGRQARRLFEALCRRFAPRVDSHIRAQLRHHAIGIRCEDIAQETWRRALAGLHRWDAAKTAFVARVLVIAKHVISEERRKAGRTTRLLRDAVALAPAAAEAGTQVDQLIARETDARVQELLQELPRHEREVVVLHGLQGHPLAEVGARLGISTDAATKRWQRGCAHIRAHRRWRDLVEA